MRRLNVGCGRDVREGWINLDVRVLPGIDVVADLETCAETPLPIEDSSIDEILCSHVLEHVQAILPLMQELWRVAKPDASCHIHVPYGSSDDAFEDPTHVRQYFLGSTAYYAQPTYWRADYGYRGDWETLKITLLIDRSVGEGLEASAMMERVRTLRNQVLEMRVEMRAIKPPREPRQGSQTSPTIEMILV